MFLHKNILCDPSVEPPHRDGSNEGSQHIISLSLNYLPYPLLSGALIHDDLLEVVLSFLHHPHYNSELETVFILML